MLVLSRKLNERILIDGDIRITVLGLRGNQVRIGIEAPGSVRVIREELTLRSPEHGHEIEVGPISLEMRGRATAELEQPVG
jgi:carbon storage regulator